MLKEGDLVIVVADVVLPTLANLNGKAGVVRYYDNRLKVGVQFYDLIKGGHDMNGLADNNNCWYVAESHLKRLIPIKEAVKTLIEKG